MQLGFAVCLCGASLRSVYVDPYVHRSIPPCLWSGAYPAISGITNNGFYDRQLGREVYCVEDANVQPIGTDAEEGQRSPHRLLVITVGDELKLATMNAPRCWRSA